MESAWLHAQELVECFHNGKYDHLPLNKFMYCSIAMVVCELDYIRVSFTPPVAFSIEVLVTHGHSCIVSPCSLLILGCLDAVCVFSEIHRFESIHRCLSYQEKLVRAALHLVYVQLQLSKYAEVMNCSE